MPTSTRPNRSVMSSLCMRMQPYGADLPIDSGLLVPWMAYSPPDRVMAATPIGLLGAPPGITSGSAGLSARTSAGGVQAGRRCLPFTRAWPCHCLPGRPTATVAQRRSVAEHKVELSLGGLDHDGARRDLSGVAHDLTGEAGAVRQTAAAPWQ